MSTKALHRFIQRIDGYEADLGLSKLLVEKFIASEGDAKSVVDIFDADKSKYPKLCHKNTKNARDILGTHIRVTLHVAFIKELYEDFNEYLSAVLEAVSKKGLPHELIGEYKFDGNIVDLLKTGSWDGVTKFVSDNIFRWLENKRSTKDLLNGVIGRIKLQIDEKIKDDAMPYLDARHVLVHTDGYDKDQKYRKKYRSI